MRFPALRQQWERDGQTSFRSLADYVAPRESGIADYLGAFAVTAGLELESLVEQFERDHDDYNAIMSKALADRLAEGLAEMLHKKAREDWGYGRDERLTIDDLIEEKYQGIRPASGYPAPRPHREARPLALAGRRAGRQDRPDRVVRDVSRRLGQRLLFRPSPGPLFRRRLHHARPGRKLRGSQEDARQRGRALAGTQPRV